MTDFPQHVALIMDGNRRWAKANHLPKMIGHERGIKRVKDIIERSHEIGLQALTFYCFSTENWSREKQEVDYLMKLFDKYIRKYVDDLAEKNVRFIHVGRKDRIPSFLLETIRYAEQESAERTGLTVHIALDYGARDEIIRAFKKAQSEGISIDSEDQVEHYLDTGNRSAVDLMIRTSGEQRLSNYLLWQLAYAELFFVPEHFPDFTPDRFDSVLSEFATRKRRFGT